MGLTDKHLAYGDDIPQTQTEKDYYWKINYQQPCDDCISRQAVIEVLKNNRYRFNISQEGYCEGKVLWSENLIKDDACKEIEQLPPVTPKEKTGLCKDCKWWKDNDGVYRRGIGAESKCPINCKKVYEGNGYCFMFEPQESEVCE